MTFEIEYYQKGREQSVFWDGDSREAAVFSFERAYPFADVLRVDRIRQNWESGVPDRPGRESA